VRPSRRGAPASTAPGFAAPRNRRPHTPSTAASRGFRTRSAARSALVDIRRSTFVPHADESTGHVVLLVVAPARTPTRSYAPITASTPADRKNFRPALDRRCELGALKVPRRSRRLRRAARRAPRVRALDLPRSTPGCTAKSRCPHHTHDERQAVRQGPASDGAATSPAGGVASQQSTGLRGLPPSAIPAPIIHVRGHQRPARRVPDAHVRRGHLGPDGGRLSD